jgi:hypothetical protein
MNLLLFPLPLGIEGGPLPAFLPAGADRVRGLRKNAYYVTMPRIPYFSFVQCLLSTALCLTQLTWSVIGTGGGYCEYARDGA